MYQKENRKIKEKIKIEYNTHPAQDIIEALLISHASSENKEDFYSEQEIFEEFRTFFVAGTDTTSHYVMMMIYYIIQNPEVEEKLRKQIETFMPGNDYSYENLKNCTYLQKIQKQTTRMYGLTSFSFELPKKTPYSMDLRSGKVPQFSSIQVPDITAKNISQNLLNFSFCFFLTLLTDIIKQQQ